MKKLKNWEIKIIFILFVDILKVFWHLKLVINCTYSCIIWILNHIRIIFQKFIFLWYRTKQLTLACHEFILDKYIM